MRWWWRESSRLEKAVTFVLLGVFIAVCCWALPGKNWPVDAREAAQVLSPEPTICTKYDDGREHCEGPRD